MAFPKNPTINLFAELKNFRRLYCCKIKEGKRDRELILKVDNQLLCESCGKILHTNVIKRDLAFHNIFTYFEPVIFSCLNKLTYKKKEEAIEFIRVQLFKIIDNKKLRMHAGKQLTMYISSSIDMRINNDHFKGYMADDPCIKGLFTQQYRFRNAKKRYIKKFKREPELSDNTDLKNLCKIYSGSDDKKIKTELLGISNNLNNAVESFEKKMPFNKNGDEFKLSDVLPSPNDSPEDECIKIKSNEMVAERLKAMLTPEQAELIRLYYLDPQEPTKEQIAKRFGWTRYSKRHGKEIYDTSRVKNNLDLAEEALKRDEILKDVFEARFGQVPA